MNYLEVLDLSKSSYKFSWEQQEKIVKSRQQNKTSDTLILSEHHPVITIGRSQHSSDNLLVSQQTLQQKGIEINSASRGGDIVYHGPGQLVAYPIMDLKKHGKDIHKVMRKYENVIIEVLNEYEIDANTIKGYTGVWVDDKKIAFIGIGARKWISFHGFAINVNNDLTPFSYINPCGIKDKGVTSMKEIVGKELDMDELKKKVIRKFCEAFCLELKRDLSPWFKKRVSFNYSYETTNKTLEKLKVNTVCQSAHCPNLSECFSNKTATFMILGNKCTRDCRFCAVENKTPDNVDPYEPERIGIAVKELGLDHVVITSVTRDDLSCGGSYQFARTIEHVKDINPGVTIEVLTPDFLGDKNALKRVVDAGPDIFNHNVETVKDFYPRVRPAADYKRTLELLAYVKELEKNIFTKSGFMVGLGETEIQVVNLMKDLRDVGCDILTIGQYLPPTKNSLEVLEFCSKESFDKYKQIGFKLGFRWVASGPFIRSSYNAEGIFQKILKKHKEVDEYER